MKRFIRSYLLTSLTGTWRSRKRATGGFTLIELLVVVAILSLLAGILFPVFSRARENARRISCVSNLKQIALAAQLYLDQNDRSFPPKTPFDSDGSEGWANSLKSAEDPGIFQCPSDEENAGGTDYWMNGGLLGTSESLIRFSSNVILFGDGTEGAADYVVGPNTDASYENWDPSREYTTRHLEGANYAFADGHVKWLHPNRISTTAPADGSNFTFVP